MKHLFVPVSYTHLDVYKRQELTHCQKKKQLAWHNVSWSLFKDCRLLLYVLKTKRMVFAVKQESWSLQNVYVLYLTLHSALKQRIVARNKNSGEL